MLDRKECSFSTCKSAGIVESGGLVSFADRGKPTGDRGCSEMIERPLPARVALAHQFGRGLAVIDSDHAKMLGGFLL